MFKDFNWKSALTTAAITIVVSFVIYPRIRPYIQKIPVVGAFFA